MKPLGKRKIKAKIHPHNECAICSRDENWDKKSRARAARESEVEIEDGLIARDIDLFEKDFGYISFEFFGIHPDD